MESSQDDALGAPVRVVWLDMATLRSYDAGVARLPEPPSPSEAATFETVTPGTAAVNGLSSKEDTVASIGSPVGLGSGPAAVNELAAVDGPAAAEGIVPVVPVVGADARMGGTIAADGHADAEEIAPVVAVVGGNAGVSGAGASEGQAAAEAVSSGDLPGDDEEVAGNTVVEDTSAVVAPVRQPSVLLDYGVVLRLINDLGDACPDNKDLIMPNARRLAKRVSYACFTKAALRRLVVAVFEAHESDPPSSPALLLFRKMLPHAAAVYWDEQYRLNEAEVYNRCAQHHEVAVKREDQPHGHYG